MIRLGLCSGAFLALETKEIVAAAQKAGLDAIEWAADAHIRPGDLRTAEETMMATLRAGMTIASYASLYRAGSEDEDLKRFEALLDTAFYLYAPNLRIFAPPRASALKGTPDGLAGELRRLGDKAAARGITLCLSLGRHSCLDDYPPALALAAEAAHPFVKLAWEDLPDSSRERASAALEKAGGNIALVIARCVDREGRALGIKAGDADWKRRISAFKRSERDPKMGSFALVASAPDVESLVSEVSALRGIVKEVEG
jgi:3-dehydroshikimate dehydratase